MTDNYPLMKSIEYQSNKLKQRNLDCRFEKNNQMKATVLLNDLNNQPMNMNTMNRAMKFPFYPEVTQINHLQPKFCDNEEKHYENNNDTISLNVDFSTDGTDYDPIRHEELFCRQLETPNINPEKYSLELSQLSSLSPVSTSLTALPSFNDSVSLPSISMELESVNQKLLKKSKLKRSNNAPRKLSDKDSHTSIFTSISSELSVFDDDSTHQNVRKSHRISSTSPYKINGNIRFNRSPFNEPVVSRNSSNNTCNKRPLLRGSLENKLKLGSHVNQKHEFIGHVTLNSTRIFQEEKCFGENHFENISQSSNFSQSDTHPQELTLKLNCFPKTEQKIIKKLQIKPVNSQIAQQENKKSKVSYLHERHQNLEKYRNKSPHIDMLENHLLVLIFSKLTTIEKLMLQFVCKRWHHIIWSQEYSYTLFKNIEIPDISIPLYCYNFKFKKNIDHESKKVTPSSKKYSLVKYLRTKLNADKALPHMQTSAQQLSDLKENNYLKFHINADLVLDFLLSKLLNRQTYPFSICVETIRIKNNHWLSDRGIDLISRRCPELNSLSIKHCSNIKARSMMNLIAKCQNLKAIDLTGCFKINNIIVPTEDPQLKRSKKKAHEMTGPKIEQDMTFESLGLFRTGVNYFYLQFIDLSYCSNINDACVLNICKTCIYLKNIYLKKCQLITDFSVLYVAKYCLYLRELSLAECNRITDTGIRYLGDNRLLTEKQPQKFQIKYLNLTRCSQITDESLIYLCNRGFFKSIKNLNLRGCTLVTDKFLKFFSGSRHIQKLQTHYSEQNKWNSTGLQDFVPFQLRSLDLAFCSITDKSIEYICRMVSIEDNLERLCLSNCSNISDNGIRILALNCRKLNNLNVKKCSRITARSLKGIKLKCPSCIIQHTNFSFC